MTYQELLQIVELINASSRLTEFHFKCGDLEVDIRRAAPALAVSPPAVSAPIPALLPSAPPPMARFAPPEAGRSSYPEGAILITAPMVGTFYRAPEPGAAPFVTAGQEVGPESIVCIIEVMKLMNSIPAGCRGIVTHIGPEDGAPVQYGDLLLVITPR